MALSRNHSKETTFLFILHSWWKCYFKKNSAWYFDWCPPWIAEHHSSQSRNPAHTLVTCVLNLNIHVIFKYQPLQFSSLVYILKYLHSTYFWHLRCVESYCSYKTVTYTWYWKVKWWDLFWHHKRWMLLKCNVTDKNQSSPCGCYSGSSIYLILPTGLYSDFEEYFTFVDEALRSSNNVIYNVMYNH